MWEVFEASQHKYFGDDTALVGASKSPLEEEVMARRRAVIQRFVPDTSRILEVGPGAGTFLRWARKQGHLLTAIEESASLARTLEATIDGKIIVGSFESSGLPDASQDVLCSFHVIEHVPDPRAHLAEAARVVRPGGLAIVATPNANSWQQRLFRRLSPNFDSAHLRVFSQASLQHLAGETGWSVVRVETPEYTSGWLRVVSKSIRKLRREDEEATAGKYVTDISRNGHWVLAAARLLTWPLRAAQSWMKGGNEILFVLNRNVLTAEPTNNCTITFPVNSTIGCQEDQL
ncbi:class I SAM-dependent methyltransferase [Phaeovulum sp.]|uniref:class I SAM-dependent methyltransferase n=1 Tax=Phaeovulum sp. TaxID=2934796 RepID=UPI002ABBFD35|nr:class I SAM-dependent methyltransferase [Phaeovulum sp.]MDZ4118033.1 class I SAM-dependent methyltransferase [Phaeovulum sp.]